MTRLLIVLMFRAAPLLLAALAGLVIAAHAKTADRPADQAPAVQCERDMCWWADLPRPDQAGADR